MRSGIAAEGDDVRRTSAAWWTALVGTVAVAVPGLVGAAWLLVPDHAFRLDDVLAAVGSVAAVVALALAVRRRDVPTSVVAVAVLVGATARYLLHDGSTPAVVGLLGQLLLVAFGVLMLRRTAGGVRVLPWLVVVGSGVWTIGTVLTTWVPWSWTPRTDVLFVVLTVPSIAATVAWLAAAALYVPPLVRPLGVGAQRLWSSADVR